MSSETDFLLDFSDFGGAVKAPSPKKSFLLNIFGKKEDKNIFKVPYTESQLFYKDLYGYYYKGGFKTIIISEILEIISLLFGISFIFFIFNMIDWEKILHCGKQNDIVDCGDISIYIKPTQPNFFLLLILILGLFFVACKIASFIFKYNRILEVCNFYTNTLKISYDELQTVSWNNIINKISINKQLTPYEITNIILKDENYLVALINSNLLNVYKKVYTKQLEFNLKYILLFDIDNLDAKKVKKDFVKYGILNLIFSPFIFLFLIVYLFIKYVDEFYSIENNKIIRTRKYSIYAKWKFREYNELRHFFERRISKSSIYANEYINQFRSRNMEVFAKFLCIISGGFIGFFLILSILDESILLYVRFLDRSLIFYAGIVGIISPISRNFIKSTETKIYNPETIMKEKIYKYTRYMPDHWKNKCNTYNVRDEFLSLYPYTIYSILIDLLSIFTTPFIMIYRLPSQSEELVEFITKNSTSFPKIGKICSYAHFNSDDYKTKKMTNSISLFEENHFEDENVFDY